MESCRCPFGGELNSLLEVIPPSLLLSTVSSTFLCMFTMDLQPLVLTWASISSGRSTWPPFRWYNLLPSSFIHSNSYSESVTILEDSCGGLDSMPSSSGSYFGTSLSTLMVEERGDNNHLPPSLNRPFPALLTTPSLIINKVHMMINNHLAKVIHPKILPKIEVQDSVFVNKTQKTITERKIFETWWDRYQPNGGKWRTVRVKNESFTLVSFLRKS